MRHLPLLLRNTLPYPYAEARTALCGFISMGMKKDTIWESGVRGPHPESSYFGQGTLHQLHHVRVLLLSSPENQGIREAPSSRVEGVNEIMSR